MRSNDIMKVNMAGNTKLSPLEASETIICIIYSKSAIFCQQGSQNFHKGDQDKRT